MGENKPVSHVVEWELINATEYAGVSTRVRVVARQESENSMASKQQQAREEHSSGNIHRTQDFKKQTLS